MSIDIRSRLQSNPFGVISLLLVMMMTNSALSSFLIYIILQHYKMTIWPAPEKLFPYSGP